LVAIIGGEQLQLCNTETGEEITQRSDAGNAVAFSHDGKWLAYGSDNERIYICDVPGLLTRRAMVAGIGVGSLAYSPDDQVLAAGHKDGTIRLWNTATGQMRSEMTGHESEVKDLAFSPDGRTLLSCDGVIRIWSVDHARSYGSFYDSANRMSLSADGRRLAVGHRPTKDDSTNVRLWDLQQMTLNR
jgi:WD40 repeat protein